MEILKHYYKVLMRTAKLHFKIFRSVILRVLA